MSTRQFPELNPKRIGATRDALHAYSRILGDVLKSGRRQRKHWWHASLRPSLRGLTTGVIYGEKDFEIELDFRRSELHVRTVGGEPLLEKLTGQSAVALGESIQAFLQSAGVRGDVLEIKGDDRGEVFAGYSTEIAGELASALSGVSAAMTSFRASIREESSPIQLWPHHFDLSMIWLPGQKVPDQDPANEEYADKQMNFGFTFGDGGIPEPYFYVTAYPLPAAMPKTRLPAAAHWKSDGFSGAVLLYKDLVTANDPSEYLQEFWSSLLVAGQTYLAADI